jgi:hypothetical protein
LGLGFQAEPPVDSAGYSDRCAPRGGGDSNGLSAVRRLRLQTPAAFFKAAIEKLESLPRSLERQRLYSEVVQDPAFLFWLTDARCLSRPERARVCGRLFNIDNFFDVRLTRMLRADEDDEVILSVLDVLDEISPGGRLIMTLSRLVRHPDKRIASKAALLLGRRVTNPLWVERHVGAEDARLRANVVEALWGTNTAFARQTLRACLDDNNNRVVGNALVGLHMLGDPSVPVTARRMLQDARAPFRWTAAWVMGRTGMEEFRESLELALADSSQQVRTAARRALRAIPVAKPGEAEAVPAEKRPEKANSPPPAEDEDASAASSPGREPQLDGRVVTTRETAA